MYQVGDDQQVVDEPIETIHLYVVKEGDKKPSLVPVLISVLALSFLIAIGVLTPYQQPEQRASIRVPAVLLPLNTFTTSVSVMPTGSKTYLATRAYGTLTITNGSILSQELPKGMIFTGKDGSEVVIDTAVFVPAGSAAGYGIAYVSAHAARAGAAGNIQTLAINQVEGTALYIRNLQPFSGGQNSYNVTFVTAQDKQHTLSQARANLQQQTVSGLLQSPCKETVTGSQLLHVTWTCQYVSYSVPDLPSVKVLHAQVQGKGVILDVVYVARPRMLTAK